MVRRGHGEGSRHKRSDGRWEWRVTLPNGQRRSFYGKTEKEARDKKNRALREAEAGIVTDAKLTLAAYLSRWLAAQAERVRPSTWGRWERTIRLHVEPHIGRKKLRELAVSDVDTLLSKLVSGGMKPSSVNQVRSMLRTALTQAEREGLVLRNVAALAVPRRAERQHVEPYTIEEARQLLAGSRDHRQGPLIALALATGLRRGELLALRWDDIEGDRLRVERTMQWRKGPQVGPPKTGAGRRSVLLNRVALDALGRARVRVNEARLLAGAAWQDLGLVFPNRHGGYQVDANVTDSVKAAMRQAGVPVKNVHALRHTAASLLLAEGMTLYDVRHFMGHSSIALTSDTYGHLMADRAATVGAALDDALDLRRVE